MINAEYDQWVNDVSDKMPETGDWLAKLPPGTHAAWLRDVFVAIRLEDAREANSRLMRDGLKVYDRERIPAIIATYVQEILWEKAEQARKVEQQQQPKRRQGSFADGVAGVLRDAGVGHAFRELVAEQTRRREAGEPMTGSQREAFVADLLPGGDPHNEPRYRCLECRDTGLASGEHNGRSVVYACYCELGTKRKEAFNARGKTLAQKPKRNESLDEWNT